MSHRDVGVIFNPSSVTARKLFPGLQGAPPAGTEFSSAYTKQKTVHLLSSDFKIPAAESSLVDFQRVGTDQFSKHICGVLEKETALLNEL